MKAPFVKTIALALCLIGSAQWAMADYRTATAELSATQLESEFEKSTDPQTRFQLALLLTTFPQTALKKKLHLYAWYCIENSKTSLTSQEASRLHRIAGDSYFDSANLENAEKHYLESLKQSDLENSDPETAHYVRYKLGWVYINQKNLMKTWRLWTSPEAILAINKTDLGRVWGELSDVSHKLSYLQSMDLDEKRWREFIKGVAKSYHRAPRSQEFRAWLTPILDLLEKHASPDLVVSAYEDMIRSNPCELREWAKRPKLRAIVLSGSSKVKPQLLACSKTLLKTGTSKDIHEMIALLTEVELTENERLARMDLRNAVKDSDGICQEYLDQKPKNYLHIVDFCFKANARNQEAAYLAIYNDAHTITEQGSKAPLLLIERLVQTGSDESKFFALMDRFGGKPLVQEYLGFFEEWARNQVRTSQWEKLHAALLKYLPLESVQTVRTLEPWIVLFEKNQLSQSEVVQMETLLQKPWVAQATHSIQEVLFAKKLDQRDWQWFWSHWEKSADFILAHKDRATAFLRETLGDSKIQLPDLSVASVRGEAFRGLTYSLRAEADLREIRKNRFWIWIKDNRGLIAPLEDKEFKLQCLDLRDKMKATEFSLNPRLEAQLAQAMKNVRTQWSKVFKRSWSNEDRAQEAKAIMTETIAALADKIENIKDADADTRAQLSQVAQAVRDWSKS